MLPFLFLLACLHLYLVNWGVGAYWHACRKA
jgi:hypothetical protein